MSLTGSAPHAKGADADFSECQAPTAGATEDTSTFTPGPMVEEIATRFRVTIATTRVGPRVVEDTDRAILDALGGAKDILDGQLNVAAATT